RTQKRNPVVLVKSRLPQGRSEPVHSLLELPVGVATFAVDHRDVVGEDVRVAPQEIDRGQLASINATGHRGPLLCLRVNGGVSGLSPRQGSESRSGAPSRRLAGWSTAPHDHGRASTGIGTTRRRRIPGSAGGGLPAGTRGPGDWQ